MPESKDQLIDAYRTTVFLSMLKEVASEYDPNLDVVPVGSTMSSFEWCVGVPQQERRLFVTLYTRGCKAHASISVLPVYVKVLYRRRGLRRWLQTTLREALQVLQEVQR